MGQIPISDAKAFSSSLNQSQELKPGLKPDLKPEQKTDAQQGATYPQTRGLQSAVTSTHKLSQSQHRQDFSGFQVALDGAGVNRLSLNLWSTGAENTGLERSGSLTGLTSQLREQGNMLRQGAYNLYEARSLLDTASSGMVRISETLSSMRDVLEGVDTGTLGTPEALVMLDSMSGELDAIVENTRWQGIAPLDGSSWGRQADVPIVSSGNGSEPVPLSLEDQRAIFSGSQIRKQLDLSTAYARKQSNDMLAGMATRAQTIGANYDEQARGYGNLSVALQSQADIMDAAIKSYAVGQGLDRAMPTAASMSQTLTSQTTGHIVRNAI